MKINIEIFYFFNLFNFILIFHKFKLNYLSIDKTLFNTFYRRSYFLIYIQK